MSFASVEPVCLKATEAEAPAVSIANNSDPRGYPQGTCREVGFIGRLKLDKHPSGYFILTDVLTRLNVRLPDGDFEVMEDHASGGVVLLHVVDGETPKIWEHDDIVSAFGKCVCQHVSGELFIGTSVNDSSTFVSLDDVRASHRIGVVTLCAI